MIVITKINLDDNVYSPGGEGFGLDYDDKEFSFEIDGQPTGSLKIADQGNEEENIQYEYDINCGLYEALAEFLNKEAEQGISSYVNIDYLSNKDTGYHGDDNFQFEGSYNSENLNFSFNGVCSNGQYYKFNYPEFLSNKKLEEFVQENINEIIEMKINDLDVDIVSEVETQEDLLFTVDAHNENLSYEVEAVFDKESGELDYRSGCYNAYDSIKDELESYAASEVSINNLKEQQNKDFNRNKDDYER